MERLPAQLLENRPATSYRYTEGLEARNTTAGSVAVCAYCVEIEVLNGSSSPVRSKEETFIRASRRIHEARDGDCLNQKHQGSVPRQRLRGKSSTSYITTEARADSPCRSILPNSSRPHCLSIYTKFYTG